MNKKKASADKNVRQKTPARQKSVSSLQGRSQQTQSAPEKSPSTQNLPHLEAKTSLKAVQVNKGIEACIPKTRLTSQDRHRDLRLSASPRLKYFPAEKIKKLDTPPAFSPMAPRVLPHNPRDTGTLYVANPDQCQDNGQGDATAATPSLHQQRQHQNVHSASQQQVAAHQTIHQVGQPNPNSEYMLSQQASANQTHRPFISQGLPDYYSQRDATMEHRPRAVVQHSPRVPAAPHAFSQQVQSNPELESDQRRNKSEEQVSGTECPDYEKQPVGGRNSALYRKMRTSKQQTQSFKDSTVPNPSMSSHQQPLPFQNHYSSQGHMANGQHPQQLYRQMQQNMVQQQQMQQRAINYQMQMMNNQQQNQFYNYDAPKFRGQFPEQGMTSPQDAMANQMKNSRMVASVPNFGGHQRDLNYTMNPQNSWPRNQVAEYTNAKAQLKPFTVDVVNNNQSQPQFGTQTQQLNPQQQFVPQYQQQPMQQQLYRNPGPGNMMAQSMQNLTAYNQHGFNQQTNPNQRPTATQSTHHLSANSQNAQSGRKKSLQFTAGMVRDQERLVGTMRQQGIPMDVMKRQFEALLGEQKRQLDYLEEMQKQEAAPEVQRPVTAARRRKQQDEKPEWMIHLTPPRLSYMELEKLQEHKNKEQQVQELQEAQQQQISNQQAPAQQSQHQFWQQPNWQQQNVPQTYSNAYVQPYRFPIGNNRNEPNRVSSGVPRMNYPQPQQNSPYYQYMQHPQQYTPQLQHYQQIYQDQNQYQGQVSSGSDPRVKNSAREDGATSSVPSSLLKMRLYKEVVKPQKRSNGLQDPEIVRREHEELTNSAAHTRGLEYMANLGSRKSQLKLNGIQDRNEMDTELQHRLIASTYQLPCRGVAANGLENSRNPDNPPPQRLHQRKLEQEFLREYPRQKQGNPRNCYSVQAEKEDGATAVQQQPVFVPQQHPNVANVIPYNDKNPVTARANIMPFRFDGTYPQHYQQMQQYYQNSRNLGRNNGEGDVGSTQRNDALNKGGFNRAGGDTCENTNAPADGHAMENKIPIQQFGDVQRMQYGQQDMHEARTIGGVRYLARKQDYIPNTNMVSPETLITSRHLQPPMVF